MRVVKPHRLSVLQRVIEAQGQRRLTLGLVAYVPLEAPEIPLAEALLWQDVARSLGKDAALDECLPKPRGEVLLFGTAFAPGGKARPAFQARLTVGAIDKTAYVVGRRRFVLGAPSEPEPLTELSLGWDKAFGGPGFAANPLGMGAVPVEEGGQKVHPLPQIEDPKNLVRSPGDRPAPWAFGPVDPTWPLRSKKAGTYDQSWLENDFPGFARDLDPEYFMVAPPEQRAAKYFQGGEPIRLENLHRDTPVLESHVPLLAARCFLSRKAEGPESLEEVAVRLDTVILLPNLRRMAVIFRGVTRITEADGTCVTCLLAALEHRNVPRPTEHYHRVWRQRLDKDKGILVALREKDLLPDMEPSALAAVDEKFTDMEDLLRRDGVAERRARERAERELESVRRTARVLGVDPDEKGIPQHLPPPEQPPRMDELAAYMEKVHSETERLQAEAQEREKQALEQARANLAEHGIDLDAEMERAKKEGGGPPKFRAEAHREQLRETARAARALGAPMDDLEAQIEDPAFFAKLVQMEEAQLTAYRMTAHLAPAARPPDDGAQQARREEVLAALAAGRSLARWDLTCADLRDLDLAGADLREALLEGADLRGSQLAGADLAFAVLARAELAGATLAGADLRDTNLGEARASGADLSGARLQQATLTRVDLEGARLGGAVLSGASLFEARLPGSDLEGVIADDVLFYECDLRSAKLDGASLRKATFFRCKLDGASFAGAALEGAGLVEVSAEGAVLRGARADNLRAVLTCALAGADLTGASLGFANLRGAKLAGAKLAGVLASGVDLSEADLTGATLARADLRGARFVRAKLDGADLSLADLMEAMLQSAHVHGALFTGANLFRADLMDAAGDGRTSFKDAHVARALFTRKRR
jgi:uncharacterized protein YjbI with pentapeptide repeats